MSTITATGTIQRSNPPLEYSKKAIRQHLQHHATNGPAYVQIQATNALARMIGLYDDAKNGITNAVDSVRDKGSTMYAKIEAIKNGTHKVTAEDIGEYATKASEDDEEGRGDEDEPH